MTSLENSGWFNHIQMPEKLDHSLTNCELPSSKNSQDQDFLGASIPSAAAQKVKHVMGWSTVSKCNGFGCEQQLCCCSPADC